MYLGKVDTSRSSRKWLLIFVIAALLILPAIAYATLVKATITITPKQQSEDIPIQVTVVERRDPKATNQLKGQILTTTTDTTAEINNIQASTVENKAVGTVTITNESSSAQTLVQNTRLLTKEGILFRTDQRINIPAGGSTPNVKITADQPGKTGEVQPGNLSIPGLAPSLQTQIYATLSSPTTGGTINASIVTQEHLNTATEQLKANAIEQAIKTFDQQTADTQTISSALAKVTLKNIKPSADIGDEATSLSATATATVTIPVFSTGEMTTLLKELYTNSLPIGKELNDVTTDESSYELIALDPEGKKATIQANLTSNTTLRIGTASFNKDNIKGKTPEQAIQFLQDFPEIESATAELRPNFLGTIPPLDSSIEIIVKEKE